MPSESPYQDAVGQASMLSSLLLLFTMLLASRLEKRQLQWKGLEGQKWWGSISRDVLNALSAAILFASLLLHGYSGPDSLLLSVGLTAAFAGMHAFSKRPFFVELGVVLVWLLFLLGGHVAARCLGVVRRTLIH